MSSAVRRGIGNAANAVDDVLGDALERAARAKHRRRLSRLGWGRALAAGAAGAVAPAASSDEPPVRDGNAVTVLIDGAEALAAVQAAIESATSHVHIAGWHAAPDFRLTPGGPPLRELLARTAERVPVRLLVWGGPPAPVFRPTRGQVRRERLEFLRGSRVECAIDVRERTMHCHHEKLVVVDDRVAFVGGIDLTDLAGDRDAEQGHPHADRLGWHDVATRIVGPSVVDVARHFAARWEAVTGEAVPAPAEQPPAGDVSLQLIRTVPERLYDFLPDGEFTILAAYLRALRSAQHLIYLENQFLWSPEVVEVLIDKLTAPPTEDFRLLLVLPRHPDNGRDTTCGQLARLIGADEGRGRLLATTLIGPTADSPGVYVHAKVGIVDDRWLTIGSANLNEHSLFNDTEVNVVTHDQSLARSVRLRLWSEHLALPVDQVDGEPAHVIDTVWRLQCDEEDAARAAGSARPVHRIRRMRGLSHRLDRLRGPLSSLVVDG
jgi:phosphatidylserine/phosphatidylglycerophosphate/cardiolipin synthase-like enzyme